MRLLLNQRPFGRESLTAEGPFSEGFLCRGQFPSEGPSDEVPRVCELLSLRYDRYTCAKPVAEVSFTCLLVEFRYPLRPGRRGEDSGALVLFGASLVAKCPDRDGRPHLLQGAVVLSSVHHQSLDVSFIQA